MSANAQRRQLELGALISGFLSERLTAKLEKLKDDDEDLAKRAELVSQFNPADWLEDAARRVQQIQAVTHSLKPIHPDARGSSLFCDPSRMPSLAEVGSHALGARFDVDVVGNAAALDVYKFLRLTHEGRSLLTLCEAGDEDLAQAFSRDANQAAVWMKAFASLSAAPDAMSSHTLAKQVYWPLGGDPQEADNYHLLAPLYPTSLAHRLFQTLQEDRFGDEARAARDARRHDRWHARPVHEYPNLAIQKMGGTKPQNISQLNSERRGDNALLASVPPVWRSAEVQAPWGVDNVFKAFRRRPEVRRLTQLLRRFLQSDPARNQDTRRRRDEWVVALLDEFVMYASELQSLAPGWTQDPRCLLPQAQRQCLDPEAQVIPGGEADMAEALAQDFAAWLNHELRDTLALGDDEFRHWQAAALELFNDLQREGAW